MLEKRIRASRTHPWETRFIRLNKTFGSFGSFVVRRQPQSPDGWLLSQASKSARVWTV
jgi:hypothetical protein